MKAPVILDFDHSIGEIDHSLRFDLSHWQDTIRFACKRADFNKLQHFLQSTLPFAYGPVFLGSGDYHHVSHLLISRLQPLLQNSKLTVVIVDNHPDNMRLPFGIHCGSWVTHTAALPFVDHVHVIGITSNDIGLGHAIENRLTPLIRSKLTYWSTRVNVSWAHRIGLKRAFRSFNNTDELISSFISAQYHERQPIYLSIDKDALSPKFIRTNWDQGTMESRHLTDLISSFSNRLIACDVTGEVSDYSYNNLFKRIISKLDGQTQVPLNNLVQWQKEQHQFNLNLLASLSNALEK